ncbi:hypothetical protein C440_01933 [Haloferax mucosum ATCC BAA-1512]|uniref:Uncharacterized protein n=1 Tax=Haloferax mucosum ATCC BAA-1512 TaxID=662479 RepID=M0IQ64_9EURY|nr:hypothetical protein [Haloferax mucosum]ELZ97968.1 hypothetical protein C440_01933 [Haloferax mucosum ATCC BAA-1512]
MRRTRRDALAGLGTVCLAGLAGCSGVLGPNESGESDDSFDLDASTVRETVALGTPTVNKRVPARISQAFLDELEARVRELLDSAPESASTVEIPNEAVRNTYTERRADALRSLEWAAEAETPFETMRSLTGACQDAAAALATYEAAVGTRTADDVLSERKPTSDALHSFWLGHRYFGDDPSQTLVVHASVENFVAKSANRLDSMDETRRFESGAPAVGELAGDLESARVALENARHITDSYWSMLSDPTDFTDVFEQTASSLVSFVTDQGDGVPTSVAAILDEFDRDLERTPAESLFSETFGGIFAPIDDASEELRNGRPASALLAVHETERNYRAFEAATAAVQDGRLGAVESAAEVRDAKLDALEAIESARSADVHPSLTRRVLSTIDYPVSDGDNSFERALDDDPRYLANDAMGQYRFAAYVARESPDVSAWLVGAVEAARGESDS